MKILLLLSGGQDSKEVLRILSKSHEVLCLTFNGPTRGELLNAVDSAKGFKHLNLMRDWFDETTWNPFKLVVRDLRMAKIAIKIAKEYRCQAIATGVKSSDKQDHKLWLSPLMKILALWARVNGIKMINPLW